MNRRMTHGTGLIFGRLVMSGPCWALDWERVTLQAQQVHLADSQKARIIGPMRRVATRASLGFYRHVLIHEGSLLVRVAFDTNGVPAWQCPHLLERCGAVRIVTVAALDQAFLDTVVIGLSKVSLLRRVASVTKFRLSTHQ